LVIVDTSVWIDFLNGVTNPESEWLDLNLDRVRIGLTTMVLAEVLQGLRDDREASLVQTQLLEFEIIDLLDAALAVEAAHYYRQLRAAGHTVRTTIDVLTATYCIREGHSLLHRDRDFDIFEEKLGLRVIRMHS
jgi:predicted nucleic acid-binding protein